MITLEKLNQKKNMGEKIVMLTAYDYPLARIVEKAGIDMILVGDSGGMVKLGYPNTIPVTMEEMLVFTKSVRRGAPNTFIISDLPFMSYNVSINQAIENAGRLVKEGGADAVKLEGGQRVAQTVKAIVDAGISVQGHIGLTPQNIVQMNGFVSQGKTYLSAKTLLDDAKALDEAGVFSLILEAVPEKLANYITRKTRAATIGTGAGNGCDGQNLISSDVIGYFDIFTPKFAKRYVNIGEIILSAFEKYKEEVKSEIFPTTEHTYPLKDEEFLNKLVAEYKWE